MLSVCVLFLLQCVLKKKIGGTALRPRRESLNAVWAVHRLAASGIFQSACFGFLNTNNALLHCNSLVSCRTQAPVRSACSDGALDLQWCCGGGSCTCERTADDHGKIDLHGWKLFRFGVQSALHLTADVVIRLRVEKCMRADSCGRLTPLVIDLSSDEVRTLQFFQ